MTAPRTNQFTSVLSMVVAAGLLLGGCEQSAAPAAEGVVVQIDSSGSVPVVTVSGTAPEWTLAPLAEIRADPEVGFSSVRSMALDPRGGVWVADTRENRLSRWGDDGNWIEDRGRVGSGPGEFRSPHSVAVHEGGLYVHDMNNRRLLRFALGVGVDTSWLVTGRMSGSPMVARLYPNRNGPLLLDLRRSTPAPRRLFVGVANADTLLTPRQETQPSNVMVCPNGGGLSIFSSPFAPNPRNVPVGNEVVESSGDGSYRLHWHDGQGTLRRIVERAAPRAPITDEEYELETADWRRFSDSMGSPACDGEIVRYAEKPSIRALLPDAEGRLWVEQERPDGLWYEVWRNDSLLARVSAPERSLQIPPVMLGDRLAVAQTLPDGGQEVRLFQIRPSAP